MNVVSTDSSEQFSLCVPIFPLFELPLLPVDEDSDDSRPSTLREVGHTVIDIELDHFVANPSTDSDHLTGHQTRLSGLSDRLFLIVAIFKERLDVGQGQVARS